MDRIQRYYKVKHKFRGVEFWLPISAVSLGAAIVKADSRNLTTGVTLCDDPAVEISQEAYDSLIEERLKQA